MGLESLEKIETISNNEIVEDKLEPLVDGSIECAESAPLEDVENLQSRYEEAEIVTDLEMSEGIADYLENVEGIKYENWQNLSLEQKEEVLNKIEQHIADIEHRPALKVELENLPAKTLGYQSAQDHKIVLNSMYVGSADPNIHKEVIKTIMWMTNVFMSLERKLKHGGKISTIRNISIIGVQGKR